MPYLETEQKTEESVCLRTLFKNIHFSQYIYMETVNSKLVCGLFMADLLAYSFENIFGHFCNGPKLEAILKVH